MFGGLFSTKIHSHKLAKIAQVTSNLYMIVLLYFNSVPAALKIFWGQFLRSKKNLPI